MKLLVLANSKTQNRSVNMLKALESFGDDLEYTLMYLPDVCLLIDQEKYEGAQILYNGSIVDVKSYDAFLSVCLEKSLSMNITLIAQANGLTTIVDPYIEKICSNKTAATNRVINAGIKTPKQVNIGSPLLLDYAVSKIGLPCVVKPNGSANGDGVKYFDTVEGLHTYINELYSGKKISNRTTLIQEFINNDYQDERYVMIENKICNAEIRHGNREDPNRRNNLSKGGTGEPKVWGKEEEKLCADIMQCFPGLVYAGIDLIRTPENELYFLEINPDPGVKVIHVTGYNHYIDLISCIIDKHEKSKKN